MLKERIYKLRAKAALRRLVASTTPAQYNRRLRRLLSMSASYLYGYSARIVRTYYREQPLPATSMDEVRQQLEIYCDPRTAPFTSAHLLQLGDIR